MRVGVAVGFTSDGAVVTVGGGKVGVADGTDVGADAGGTDVDVTVTGLEDTVTDGVTDPAVPEPALWTVEVGVAVDDGGLNSVLQPASPKPARAIDEMPRARRRTRAVEIVLFNGGSYETGDYSGACLQACRPLRCWKKDPIGPVSRVLYRTMKSGDDHLSRTSIARRLVQPTRGRVRRPAVTIG